LFQLLPDVVQIRYSGYHFFSIAHIHKRICFIFAGATTMFEVLASSMGLQQNVSDVGLLTPRPKLNLEEQGLHFIWPLALNS
jgi:hypothetical protein